MRSLLPASRNRDRFILLAAAALVLALGCQPAMVVDAVITAKSCTNNAHTMTFVMHSNSPINGALFDGGTPNVLGIRSLYYPNQNTYDLAVVSELDNVMKNDKVQEAFHAGVTIQGTVVVSLADLAFYQANWQNIGAPDCGPIHSPQFTVTYTPAPGSFVKMDGSAMLSISVSDPYPLPLSLVSLDLVQSQSVLDPSLLDWDSAGFNALPWVPAAPNGAMLDAASPPLAINAPVTPAGAVVLARYVSIYDGMEVRGIMQLTLTPPLATWPTTWGAVKALYRG